MKNNSIDPYFESARKLPLAMSFEEVQALFKINVVKTTEHQSWWTIKNLIIMTTTAIIIATVGLFINQSVTTNEIQSTEPNLVNEVTTNSSLPEGQPEFSNATTTTIVFNKIGDDSVKKETRIHQHEAHYIEEEIISPAIVEDKQVVAVREGVAKKEVINKVEFIITELTTVGDINKMIEECKKHKVVMEAKSLKFKDEKLTKFRIKMNFNNSKRMTARCHYDLSKTFEWKFGWVLDVDNKIEGFYTGDPEKKVSCGK